MIEAKPSYTYRYVLLAHAHTALGDDVIISLENIEDCNRYLWGEVGGERVRKSVDKLLDMFQVDRGTTLRPIMVRERERERESVCVGGGGG